MAGGSSSKNKGGQGERELCKILGDVFNGSFIRAAHSGAFVGGKNAVRKQFMSEGQIRNTKADIVTPDFMPRLVIEAKWYKDFNFHHLLQPGPNVKLDAWIEQTLDCVDDGDLWFVCFKINRRGWFIAVPGDFCDEFVFKNHSIYTGGAHGDFKITDLKEFIVDNKEAVLRLSA